MYKGQKITLRGISQKGKTRINQWGSEWEVMSLNFSNKVGVRSLKDKNLNNTFLPPSFRWIDLPTDSDMEILI